MMQVFCGIALCVVVAASALAEEGQAAADSLKGGEMVKIAGEKSEFYIDKYEVTNEEYAAFLTEKGNAKVEGMYWVELGSRYTALVEEDGVYKVKEGFARHPVIEVSWYGAMAYCQWAGKRLPTQEEWQFACEGTEGLKYPWGGDFEEGRANIFGDKDGYGRTAPVGSFPSGVSPFGLLDMGGNVWEWTQGGEKMQFLRGGSWVNGPTLTQCNKRTNTKDSHSYIKGNTIGFRCAR